MGGLIKSPHFNETHALVYTHTSISFLIFVHPFVEMCILFLQSVHADPSNKRGSFEINIYFILFHLFIYLFISATSI